MDSLATLLDNLPQVGTLHWIGLRPASHKAIKIVSDASLVAGRGIAGDHRHDQTPNSKRQVSLIQQEHLTAIASLLHRDAIPAELVRRNLVVSGINLLALKGKQFQIGEARLEYTGLCEPCSRMEQSLGPGGYNAMRGHGGITARIITTGYIQVGDDVQVRVSGHA